MKCSRTLRPPMNGEAFFALSTFFYSLPCATLRGSITPRGVCTINFTFICAFIQAGIVDQLEVPALITSLLFKVTKREMLGVIL